MPDATWQLLANFPSFLPAQRCCRRDIFRFINNNWMRPWLITLASTLIIPRIWENPNSIIVLLYIVSWKLYKNSLWSDKTVFLNKYWGKFVKNSTRARKNDLSLLSYKVTGLGKTFSVTTTRLVTSASTEPFQNGELMVLRQEYKNCLCENSGWQNSWLQLQQQNFIDYKYN